MTPMRTDLPGTYLSTVPLLDPPTVRAAALTVAEHATNPDGARTFLAQLGLCGQTLTPSTTARLDCGHPVTDGYRHPNQGGIICRACAARRDHRTVHSMTLTVASSNLLTANRRSASSTSPTSTTG